MLYEYYILSSLRQLHAEGIRQMFCTIVPSLMMGQCVPKHVAVGVL